LFGLVGALIVSREPGNRIGVLLLYGSGATAASFVAGEVTTVLVREGLTDGPVVGIPALVSEAGWVVGIIPVPLFLPLLFPDGHLPSRRWLPFAWFCFGVLAFLFVAVVFATPKLTGSAEVARVDNPLYLRAIDTFEIPDAVVSILLLIVLVGSVGSLVVRFRRSRATSASRSSGWRSPCACWCSRSSCRRSCSSSASRRTSSMPSSRALRSSRSRCPSVSPCSASGCTSSTSW
jgi:hypothetical protein